jgi:hypothetical protein
MVLGSRKEHSNLQCKQVLFIASLFLVRGFATAGLGAGTLGLYQKVEICSPRYLARGRAVLEVEVLTAKDFASLDNILNVA